MGVGGQGHAPAAFTPGKYPVPIIQKAGWAPGPVSIGAENLAPALPGFDPRTLQPAASRYTDWVIPAHGVPKYSKQKPVPRLLDPPQIPHELGWDRTWASWVYGLSLFQFRP
jgi:hypothetical protein